MQQRDLISPEAEHGVLGALLRKPDLCEEIGAFLPARDFADDDNAMIYNLILAGHAKGVRPDPIVLSEICERLPSGESTIYLVSMIMRDVPSAANGVHYARIVAERSGARRLFSIAQNIMNLAQSQGSLSSQIAQAQQSLFEMNIQEDTPDVVTYREALGHVIEEMQDRLDGKANMGLMFGLADLDKIIRGLRPGNLVIIAGKPGTGKTVLGTGLADKIAIDDGLSALVFSLEMANAELAKRSLASISGVSKDRIESGEAVSDLQEEKKIVQAMDKLRAADVRLCDRPSLAFSRLCNIARFQHRAKKLDLIVVDYLTMITSDANSRHSTRSQEVGMFSRGLKALAKELGIPVVALAQLNRAMDSRSEGRPKMSDLRDSGEIEQDADVIIMGYRDENNDRGRSGITEWEVVKCRHSKPGHCVLQFQGAQQRFVNVLPASAYDYEEKVLNKPIKGLKAFANNHQPGFD
jgi:replicative DNA helicase